MKKIIFIIIAFFCGLISAQSNLLLIDSRGSVVSTPATVYDSTTTSYIAPTSTGEDYTQWNDAADSYSSNDLGGYPSANGNRQDFYGFNFNIPAGAEIVGVEASLKFTSWEAAGTSTIGVEISANGGTSYSATSYQVSTALGTWVMQTVGGITNLWGLTLTQASFSTSNFRIRVTGIAGVDAPTLDMITVRVRYRVVH